MTDNLELHLRDRLRSASLPAAPETLHGYLADLSRDVGAVRPGRPQLPRFVLPGASASRTTMLTRLAAAAAIGVIAVGGALYMIQRNESAVGGPSPTPGMSPSPSPSTAPPRTPSWTITGSMANSRGGFSATLLPGGQVLVAGGLGGFNFPDPAADELYDPATGSWVTTGGMVNPRANFSATLLANGKVLVLGGQGCADCNVDTSSYAELYDPGTGSWSVTGGIHHVPPGHTATLLANGKVLVAGGMYNLPNGNGASLTSAELYDPVSGTWATTGNMLTRRARGTATLLVDGKVLVVGGDDFGSGTLASAEVYDPGTGTWTATGSMHEVRAGHTATRLLDGRVLVGGGVSNEPDTGTASGSAELYDPSSGSWSVTGSMTTARMYATATVLSDGAVFVVGGAGYYGDGAWLASAELYDAATGSWSTTGTMNDLIGLTATLLPDGKVLVVGGNAAELYDPGSSP